MHSIMFGGYSGKMDGAKYTTVKEYNLFEAVTMLILKQTFTFQDMKWFRSKPNYVLEWSSQSLGLNLV